MYAYVCDWLGFPYREEVQWVSVSVCVCVHAHTRSPTLIYTVIRTRPHSYTYMHTRTPTQSHAVVYTQAIIAHAHRLSILVRFFLFVPTVRFC